MAISKLKKIYISDRAVSKFQENTRIIIDEIVGKEILDGVLIKNIDLVAGVDNIISHKLNRNLLGWIIIKKNTQSDIWEKSGDFSKKNLILNCSADTTISIWIF